MKFDEYLKKERTRHLEFFLSYMNDEFFFCHLNWSIVNTVQESTHECWFLLTIQITGNCNCFV